MTECVLVGRDGRGAAASRPMPHLPAMVLTLRGCVRVCNTPALQRAHARHAARLDLSRARSGVRTALSRQLALERLQWPGDLAQHWAMLGLQVSDSAHRSQRPGNVLIAHSDDIDSGAPQHAARTPSDQNFTTHLQHLAAQGVRALTHRLCRIRSTPLVDNRHRSGDFFATSLPDLVRVGATIFIHRLVMRDSTATVENPRTPPGPGQTG
ncbi:hypothetical protein GGR74_000159 [Xanthomonas arboricola]